MTDSGLEEGDVDGKLHSRSAPKETRRARTPMTNRFTWVYLLEFLGGITQPWDRGVLDAHFINCGTTKTIEEHLSRARRCRRGPLALISKWRRVYLDGLIWSLEMEIGRRSRS